MNAGLSVNLRGNTNEYTGSKNNGHALYLNFIADRDAGAISRILAGNIALSAEDRPKAQHNYPLR